jgi:hypothetical protein
MSTYDEVLVKRTLSPAARTATASGVAVDRVVSGGTQDAVAIVTTGTITDATHAISIEDSADGSTGWAAVPSEQLQGAVPTIGAADDDKVYEIGVLNSKRYLRVTVTVTGATSGGTLGAVVALGRPRFSPFSHA